MIARTIMTTLLVVTIRRQPSARRDTMQRYPGTIWPPGVGDNVSIKGTALGGVVERIDAAGDDARYILNVYGHASSSASGALGNAADAAAARTDYALDELEPARR
jgi:hypothetical protein